jgi:hypothetical protein
MSNARRTPLLFILAVILVGVGLVSSLSKATNPAVTPGGLGPVNAESTALYCTGLSGDVGPLEGHVVFLNTTNATRSLAVQVVNDLGQRANTTLKLAAHATTLLSPISLLKGHSYAVEAQVSGGGVVAQEVTRTGRADVPCTSTGVTNWYEAGFDTLVGSSGEVSVYNPTATPAVFNLSTYSTSGFSAPAPFQGLSVGAHSEMEVDLGAQIVNASNIAVHVSVLRGALAIVGVQQSGSVVSLSTGETSLTKVAWYPLVTTVNRALAQIRIANPSALAANVTADVSLPNEKIAPQVVSIPPYSSSAIVITPNSAIPPSGYANVRLTSNVAVTSTLVTGTSEGLSLWSPQMPSNMFLLSNFSGLGFNNVTFTNTSSRSVTVHFASLDQTSTSSEIKLAPNATQVFSGIAALRAATTYLVSASSSAVVVTATLPSAPIGVTVVPVLNGG